MQQNLQGTSKLLADMTIKHKTDRQPPRAIVGNQTKPQTKTGNIIMILIIHDQGNSVQCSINKIPLNCAFRFRCVCVVR